MSLYYQLAIRFHVTIKKDRMKCVKIAQMGILAHDLRYFLQKILWLHLFVHVQVLHEAFNKKA